MSELSSEPIPDPYEREPYIPALADYMQSLRPAEVVAMQRAASEAIVRKLDTFDKPPFDTRLEDQLSSDIFAAMTWLPELNLPFAREVFQGLADSTVADDRDMAANIVSTLTPFDHDFGLNLWRNLACDRDGSVRYTVQTELGFLLGEDNLPKSEASAEDAQRLEVKGITFAEGIELLRSGLEAERTGQFYDPGVMALRGAQRALWGPPPPESPTDPPA